MIDHCVSAFDERIRLNVYQEYVADCLMYINQSVAEGLGGSYLPMRFAELVGGKESDTRTADEIVLDVIERAGLSIRGDN